VQCVISKILTEVAEPITEESPKPEDMAEDVASNAASVKDGSTNGTSKRSRPNGKRARTARSAAWNQDAASTTSGKNGKEKSASPKETIEGADSGADNGRAASATEAGAAADADSNAAAAASTTNGDGGRHSNGRRGRAGTTNGVGHASNHNGSSGGGSGGGAGGGHGAGAAASSGREPSWTELKKKAGLMLDYISQAQVDMARAERKGLVRAEEPSAREVNRRSRLGPHGPTAGAAAARAADVVAAGMANELATRLVKWQRDFTVEQHPATAMLVDAEGR
jgi:hypothetical protein